MKTEALSAPGGHASAVSNTGPTSMNGSSPIGGAPAGGGGFHHPSVTNTQPQSTPSTDHRPSVTWGALPGELVSVLRPPFYHPRLEAANPMLYPNPADPTAGRLLRPGGLTPFQTGHHHHLLPSPYQLYGPGAPLHMAGNRNPYLELLAASGAIPRYHRYLSQSPSPRMPGSMPPPAAPGLVPMSPLEHQQRSQSDSDGLVFRGPFRSTIALPKVQPRTAVGPILPLAPAQTTTSSCVRIKSDQPIDSSNTEGRSSSHLAATPDSSGSGANLPTQPYYPSHFMRGTVIQLASGQLKSVEDLNTEDFIRSASLSNELKMDSSTVVKIEEKTKDTVLLCFSVGEHKVQVSVEATVEHPFFVIGQGWSSCSPERTRSLYGLACQRLQVGDICISLTHRDLCQRFPSTASAVSNSITCVTHRSKPLASSTMDNGSSTDSGSPTNGRRSLPACAPIRREHGTKRRWSCSS